MKKLLLDEILIISHKEKAAKKVAFDRKRTIILGKNDCGKSSLIKTILQTFGAEPKKIHSDWKALNPTSLVKFTIDDNEYALLKDGKTYTLYQDGMLIRSCKSVTNELGPLLADILDFRIKLTDRNNKSITPPPAFIFMPFYIDQDKGWSDAWNSFSRIEQFKKSVDATLLYHTGIRPNKYYETKGEIDIIQEEIRILTDELKLTSEIADNIKDELSNTDFNINIDEFKEEVKELLVECDHLKAIEEKHKNKLIDLYNHSFIIEAQITIAEESLGEAKKDYKFITDRIEHIVECPTCGAEYENTFIERFEIAKDTDRCLELITELVGERNQKLEEIEKLNDSLSTTVEEIKRIETILSKKKGTVALKDVIDNAGRSQLKAVFSQKLEEIREIRIKKTDKLIELNATLKALEDKKRKERILLDYEVRLRSNSKALDVPFSEKIAKTVTAKVDSTGSALPRTLMAYYFSIFGIIKEHGSIFCPIIIDSPNQQAQDLGHIDKILNFIHENQTKDSQLILGLEELYDTDFNCDIIRLDNKYRLLQKEDYENVNTELKFYTDQVLLNSKTLF